MNNNFIAMLIILFFASVRVYGNDCEGLNSTNGSYHTLKGNLNVLIIYVAFTECHPELDAIECADLSDYYFNDQFPDCLESNGTNLIQGHNSIISKDEAELSFVNGVAIGSDKRNITDYYHEMSGGIFNVTGQIFPEVISINDEPTITREELMQLIAAHINQSPHLNDIDWIALDQRNNDLIDNPFSFDNSGSNLGPDGKLDYVNYKYKRRC